MQWLSQKQLGPIDADWHGTWENANLTIITIAQKSVMTVKLI